MNATSLITAAKKQPIGAICGAVCLICAVLLYIRGDKIDESQAMYDAKAAEAARIMANVRNSAKLPEQLVEIQAYAKDLESRLVVAGRLAVNLQYFYKLEAENEVKLVDIRQNSIPTNKIGKSLYTGVPYAVSVQGSYKQVISFLARLEGGRHFCHFTNVSLNKSQVGGVPDAMTLTLGIELLGTP
jgi:Tfp pilus assembly protein PilO